MRITSLRRRRLPNGRVLLESPEGLTFSTALGSLKLVCGVCGDDATESPSTDICRSCKRSARRARAKKIKQPWELDAA